MPCGRKHLVNGQREPETAATRSGTARGGTLCDRGSDVSGGSGGERLLITVCVHGNEPCGPAGEPTNCSKHSARDMRQTRYMHVFGALEGIRGADSAQRQRLLPWRCCQLSAVTAMAHRSFGIACTAGRQRAVRRGLL